MIYISGINKLDVCDYQIHITKDITMVKVI